MSGPVSDSPLSPLERLQLLVPGFRGYKIKDLIRQDDFLVRQAITQSLEEARRLISSEVEEKAINDPFSESVQRYERLISELRSLISDIQSAPLGDSGMHDRFKLFPEDLEKIVQFDLTLINSARAILEAARSRKDPDSILLLVKELHMRFTDRLKLMLPESLR
ncbi:MAG: hypothetical protein ACP5NY_07560 [Thermocladium sp.]